MKAIVIVAFLVFAVPSRAQTTYDFTISPDPHECNGCANISGSGSFEIGTWTTTAGIVLAPINSLMGSLNGLPLSLTPGKIGGPPLAPTASMNGNMFQNVTNPIVSAYPLFFESGQLHWNIAQSDFLSPPSTGTTLYSDNLAIPTSPIKFSVSAAPTFLTRNPTPAPVGTFTLPAQSSASQSVFRANHNVAITVSLTAAISTGIMIYEWHKHRQHRYALPAGRLE